MKDIRWITEELRLFFYEEMELFFVTKKQYHEHEYADLNLIISSSSDEKNAIEKALVVISKKNEELTNILNKIKKSFTECPDVVDIHCSLKYNTESITLNTDEETIVFDTLIYDKKNHGFIPLVFKTKKNEE